MEILVEEKGQNNLVFAILLQIGDSTACVDLLTKTQRAPEQLYLQEPTLQGTFFLSRYLIHLFFRLSLSYLLIHSSQAPKAAQARKSEITSKKRTKFAATIADPSPNPELFDEGWEEVLVHEETHGNSTLLFFLRLLRADYILVDVA
jgi:coatomer subunit beta'